jgi:hypothetical protein
MNLKPVLIVLSVVSFISACNKNDSQPVPDPPTSEPLAIAAAKPGDTLYVKGANFSEAVAGNTVKINGVEATVVAASATELKVIVPANASSGAITVTVNGQTVEVGSITIVPFTIFVYKRNYQDLNNYLRQIYTIDPATGQETLFYNIQDTMGTYLDGLTYSPATNEVVGLTDGNRTLFRLNISTKQVSYLVLSQGFSSDFMDLVVDKSANLYGIKRDWQDPNRYMESLIKIDLKANAFTTVKTFAYDTYVNSLVYLASTNEIVALAEGNKSLLKLNLTTKDTSFTKLPLQDKEDFYELAVDNQSNLYGFKGNYADPNTFGFGQILKLNPVTGQGTLLTTFYDYTSIRTNLLYLPQRNEIAAIWNDGTKYSLYKLNIETKAASTVLISSQINNIDYGELSCN